MFRFVLIKRNERPVFVKRSVRFYLVSTDFCPVHIVFGFLLSSILQQVLSSSTENTATFKQFWDFSFSFTSATFLAPKLPPHDTAGATPRDEVISRKKASLVFTIPTLRFVRLQHTHQQLSNISTFSLACSSQTWISVPQKEKKLGSVCPIH